MSVLQTISQPFPILGTPPKSQPCKARGVTGTVWNVLHGWSRGQKNEQQNNVSSPENNAAAGYQGPVKIELLKDAGLLNIQ